MRGSGPRSTICAAGSGADVGAGAGVPFLVGAVTLGRRRLPQNICVAFGGFIAAEVLVGAAG